MLQENEVTIEKFQELLNELGGNQKLIAEALGESPMTITNIKKGRIKVKKSHLLKLIGLKTSLNGKKLK